MWTMRDSIPKVECLYFSSYVCRIDALEYQESWTTLHHFIRVSYKILCTIVYMHTKLNPLHIKPWLQYALQVSHQLNTFTNWNSNTPRIITCDATSLLSSALHVSSGQPVGGFHHPLPGLMPPTEMMGIYGSVRFKRKCTLQLTRFHWYLY